MLRRVFVPLALAVGCGMAAPGMAAVEVRVTTPDGKPLEGAVVFLEPREGRPPVAAPRPTEISQVQRRFVPEVTVIPVGSPVSFPNRDTVRHHVYSFSPAKRFEIKLYVGTPAEPVIFDKPGIAVLGCNIHDDMTAWVVILDTPWWGRSAADGRAAIAAAPPPGRYRLRAWHAGMAVGDTPIEREWRIDALPAQTTVELVVRR